MESRQVPLPIRFVYFLLAGLWLGAIAAAAGWVCCVTIIGLPLGIFILHRLPLVMTLKLPDELIVPVGRGYQALPGSSSPPFPVRALWFLLLGWWLSFLWIKLAFLASATIIFSPIGFWMINRVPAILTLEGV